MREEDSGLDCSPITAEACQGPLGTWVLINALSESKTGAEKRGEERLSRTMSISHSLAVTEITFIRSFFSTLRLRLPPSVFEVSPPSPRLAPPTIVGHELLINLGDRKDITALCCALTYLFCEGSALLPKGSAFAYGSVNIILNINIVEILRISLHLSTNDWWTAACQSSHFEQICHRR